ncbi:MAG: hypothetical protein PVH04_02395 [Gammaproteobacteria bacterium]
MLCLTTLWFRRDFRNLAWSPVFFNIIVDNAPRRNVCMAHPSLLFRPLRKDLHQLTEFRHIDDRH